VQQQRRLPVAIDLRHARSWCSASLHRGEQ